MRLMRGELIGFIYIYAVRVGLRTATHHFKKKYTYEKSINDTMRIFFHH